MKNEKEYDERPDKIIVQVRNHLWKWCTIETHEYDIDKSIEVCLRFDEVAKTGLRIRILETTISGHMFSVSQWPRKTRSDRSMKREERKHPERFQIFKLEE